MIVLLCKNCGKEYEETLESCPFCQEQEENPSEDTGNPPEDAALNVPQEKGHPSVSEDRATAVSADAREESIADQAEASEKPELPMKKRNYDFVTKSRSTGQNVVLKAVIAGLIMLILAIGIGTVSYIMSDIKSGSVERTAQLMEKGAVMGVSKNAGDSDIGSKFYVSGVIDELSLYSEPSNKDAEELEALHNGMVVILVQKASASFWKVTDLASDQTGYVPPTFLTKDADSIIVYSNEQLSANPGVDAKDEKVIKLCYVINAGDGVPLYNTKDRVKDSEISTLVDGNTVGVTDDSDKDVWRVYDYKSTQYGFMESKYLTDDYDDILALQEAVKTEKEEEEDKHDGKLGPEYTDSWSDSGLSVRNDPTKETGNQIDRLDYGDTVQLIEKTNEDFWYIYIPDKDLYGYVRSTCLTPVDENDTEPYEDVDAKDAKKEDSKKSE